ncbi:MAG TPA: sensor domain-containing diguanylate cyclase [bacterium]|nr:sensor domain-containing diguanylate cyclase [bacterium]
MEPKPADLESGWGTTRSPRTESDKLLAFLAGLATELATVLDLPVLLQHIIRAVHEAIGFDSCAVSLLERHGADELLVVKTGSGLRAGVSGLRFTRGQGLAWEVMENQTPVLVPDLHADPRVIRKDPGVRSGIYAPMVSRNRPIGVLSAYRSEVNAFAEGDLHLLTVVAHYIANAVEVSQLHDALKALAATDGLTGIPNRRTFMERFEHEIARSERTSRPLSVMLLDLDGFKVVNDTYGHRAGDAVLVAVASILGRELRTVDLVARYGGDEFAVLLPETEETEAGAIADRFLGVTIPLAGWADQSIGLQFSWGIAAWPGDGSTADQLLQAADLRLYRMKEHHHQHNTTPPREGS